MLSRAHNAHLRGSVLAYVVVLVAVGSVVLLGLLKSAATRAAVNADRQAVLDVGRVLHGVTQSLLRDASDRAVTGGSYTPSFPYGDSAWRMSSWTALQVPPAGYLLEPSVMQSGDARDPGLPGTLVWETSLSQAYPINGTLTLDFVADASISRTETVSAGVHKIPTGAIPLVCYNSPLSTNLPVNVDGPVYLAGGISSSAQLNVSSGHTFVGRGGSLPSQIKPAWALSSGRVPPIATWGVSDPSSLINACYRAGSALEIVVSDPDEPPAPLSREYWMNGEVLPVLDLGSYGGTGVLVIESSRGVALLGSSGETGTPLTIVISGTVYLVGSNSRAVTIVTQSSINLVSGTSEIEVPDPTEEEPERTRIQKIIPTSGSAGDAFWKAYICSPVDNLSFGTDEDWSGSTFRIMGGLAFRGGTLSAGSVSAISISAPDASSVGSFKALFAPPCRYDALAVFQGR